MPVLVCVEKNNSVNKGLGSEPEIFSFLLIFSSYNHSAPPPPKKRKWFTRSYLSDLDELALRDSNPMSDLDNARHSRTRSPSKHKDNDRKRRTRSPSEGRRSRPRRSRSRSRKRSRSPKRRRSRSRWAGQGCQMVYFQTINPNLSKFWRVLQWKVLVPICILCAFGILRTFGIYIMSIWCILWPFGIFFRFGVL
jgi:hypothetical protein